MRKHEFTKLMILRMLTYVSIPVPHSSRLGVMCQTTSSDAKQRGCPFIADKGCGLPLRGGWMTEFFQGMGKAICPMSDELFERRGVKAGPQATAESGA